MSDLALSEVRSIARALVEREEDRTRSRMTAYEKVAAQVGRSGSWLRKWVNDYSTPGIPYTVGCKIKSAYDELCREHRRRLEHELAVTRALVGSAHPAVASAEALLREAPAQPRAAHGVAQVEQAKP